MSESGVLIKERCSLIKTVAADNSNRFFREINVEYTHGILFFRGPEKSS